MSSEARIEAIFSEPMLAPGADTAGNYTLSGIGAGTLTAMPDNVTGSGPYSLVWSSGEMLDGGPVSLTVSDVQDAVGNLIDTGADTASSTGVGIAPVFGGLAITPAIAGPGDTVSISFASSEDLDAEPAVTVNGNPATFAGSAKATSFAFEYTVEETDPLGTAAVEISGFDPAGNLGTLSGSFSISATAGLPLNPWPVAMVLLLAGLAVLLRRKRISPVPVGDRNLGRPGNPGGAGSPGNALQSRRDCIPQPRVATQSLPGERAMAEEPRRGSISPGALDLDNPSRVDRGLARTPGSACGATRGFGIEPLRGSEGVGGDPKGRGTAETSARKGWRVFFPLIIACLYAAPSALAQAPTVSNVAFTQQATATGTKVVITYDLDSPNGPSDIMVALSKDGGSDGFSFPVTSMTGDLTGVSSGTGCTITWDLAADYPDEDIPNAQLRVTADDGFGLPEMIPVAAGSFDMGNSGAGDDGAYGASDEAPVHTVMLSAYAIGTFEVTNQQVCDVFNWAHDRGLLTTVNSGTATAFGQELLDLDASGSHIEYVGGAFEPETRTGDSGGATVYPMADHPVQSISWYGAAAYCNWLSEISGLAPVYDTSAWTANFANNGFHLPTEAQWERAAAWDGAKHWTYSFLSDTLTGRSNVNYYDSGRVNPLGLTSDPTTSPAGWFNGSHVSPNGSIATVDSLSPVGAYDMSGNVWEWCNDWYDSGYYSSTSAIDPAGPAPGNYHARHSRRQLGKSGEGLPRGGAQQPGRGLHRQLHRVSPCPEQFVQPPLHRGHGGQSER